MKRAGMTVANKRVQPPRIWLLEQALKGNVHYYILMLAVALPDAVYY